MRVRSHDFPEIPAYHLPKLKRIAPEAYDELRTMPVLSAETWKDVLVGEYVYACQDSTFG